jgi:hypothetical protein
MSKKYTVALRTPDGFHEVEIEAESLSIGDYGLALRDANERVVAQFIDYAWVKEEIIDE